MKTLFTISCIVMLFMTIKAQTVPPGEDISLDEQLSNIDKSSVTSGIIYERVIPAANLYAFNSLSTFNTANYTYFKQALSELHNASNQTKFLPVANLKTTSSNNKAPNSVDLAILNSDYHILNYNEENPSQGGLTYNTSSHRFQPISGKAPFIKRQTTVIAPIKDYVVGTSVTYIINNNLYFKNTTKPIKTLVANFGDGVNRTLINNQSLTNQNITVSYPSTGNKKLTFTITYSDNSTLTTYGKMYFQYRTGSTNPPVATPSTCLTSDPLKGDFELQADIPFTGYNSGDPKIKAKIQYRIFYANADKKIRKPIIIIDGFDPGDKRKFEDCDCGSDPDCASRNVTNDIFDPENHRSMVDLMEYYNGIEKKKLIDDNLKPAGYDVILVNHPTYQTTNINTGAQVTIDGGAYYIESNAMALVKLIQQTNGILTANGSTAKIAIVGPSMGGQISRYALSYMEKNNLPHNTYLWISVDSPHLGANIPMGDQALIYLLKQGGIDQAEDFYDKELSSPAAQQQLIEFHRAKEIVQIGAEIYRDYHRVDESYLNAQVISQGMPTNRGNNYFQQHYNNQNNNGLANSKGWPQNVRRISIVNGSLTGSRQTQTPNGQPFIPFASDNEKVLNYRGFQRVGWPIKLFDIHIASLEAHFMPNYNQTARIARFKKLFTDRTTKSINLNSRGVMDNVPGGFFDAQADLGEGVASGDPVPGEVINWNAKSISFENIFKTISEILGGSKWYLHDYNPIHSFIPSFSAIAHKNPNQSWYSPLDYNLICTNETPFHSYFGLANNTQHTSFTKESVDWLINELNGIPQEPYFPINLDLLEGQYAACTGVNATYSFNACKIPGNVKTWTHSTNLQKVSHTGNSITVKAPSDSRASGWVQAEFNNGVIVRKDVWVGKPNTPTSLSGPSTVQTGALVNYSAGSSSGSTGYDWRLPYPFTTVAQFDYFGQNWQLRSPGTYNIANAFTGYAKNSGYVQAMGKNNCGSGGAKLLYVTHSSSGGGGIPRMGDQDNVQEVTVYPNPATTKVNIQLTELTEYEGEPPTLIYAIQVLDQNMNQRKFYEFSNHSNNVEINIGFLSSGQNYLIVYTDSGTFTKKLIVY